MADRVREALERSIPELRFLQQFRLFSQDEIRDIVRNRKRYEYSIVRRSATKLDFLAYIQYEFQLEMTKRVRMSQIKAHAKRLASKKVDKVEVASIFRIFSLYERALSRFRRDLDLWKQYLSFCEKLGYKKKLTLLFTRALQFNSHVPDIWILAAEWERKTNKDVKIPRVLYQRALRFNPQSRELWYGYFSLELKHLRFLLSRPQIKNATKSEKTTAIDVNSLPEATGESASSQQIPVPEETPEIELDEMAKLVLKGSIPLTIYHHAMKAIENDFSFGQGFLSITKRIHICENVADDIKKDLQDKFGKNPVIWAEHALNSLHEEADWQKKTWTDISGPIQLAQDFADQAKSVESWEKIVEYYSTVSSFGLNAESKTEVDAQLTNIFSTLSKSNTINQAIAEGWARFLSDNPNTQGKVNTIRDLSEKFPLSKTIYLHYASFLAASYGQTVLEHAKEIEGIFEKALSKCAKGDHADIWMNYIAFCSMLDKPWSDIERHFQNAINKIQIGNYVPLKEAYLRMAFYHENIEKVRQLMNNPHMKNGSCSTSIYLLVISMEESCTPASHDCIRRHFDTATTTYGATDIEIWVEAAKFEKRVGNISNMGTLLWKAKKAVPATQRLALDQRFAALTN